ncbi:aspartate aminotransferase family protein [Amycolatopsis sp. SID8362]|uniref:aminotransferase family protein n=1 Tax=Amycolatopsis sp. SID8362 TaxID=2690346 RepID=UPI00136C4A3D|nr:aspartate aminotransferase family protein [Amycolatopsis sp. SID8362]NBH08132.1 aminotransferase class III-fold pyridoxal phosphate-dependent enzyme [Amycolatopsis sp. SID8362]NED44826.1 aspartate aminotransferase family protein [Amycolatopsis sp. SID8362]
MSAQHALWHPFADMGAVDGDRMVITRGEGSYVWDDAGRRYFDATASLWYANFGHGRPEITDAVAKQLRTLDSYNLFGYNANEPAIELADRVAALAPEPGSKVFFGSGGGDVIDTAVKLARAYFAHTGRPEKVHVIGRAQGYHGTHGFGTAVGGIPANAAGFGPQPPDFSHVPYDSAAALEAEIERVGASRVAAFFCEPVIGAGGVLLPPDGYIEEVAAICRRHDVLFVADCVIAAWGRLGTWFGIDRWAVRPDMITTAKGITGGTIPLGALIVAPRVAEPFFTGAPGAPIFRHGATYAGHPVACAAGLATLDIYERDGLIPRGRELEKPLADAVSGVSGHPLVAEVRAGLGFLAAVELTAEVMDADPGAPVKLQRACRDEGVIVRNLGRGVAVSPPLIAAEPELDLLAAALPKALDRLAAQR